MRRLLRYLALLLLLGAVPLVLSRAAPVRGAVIAAMALMRGGGAAGVAVYFAVYAAGSIVTAPCWIFSGMAGYAYGPVRGVLLASPANLCAATAAFLLGRSVLAGRLGRRLAESPRWVALQRAVGADAFRIGVLLRITPVVPQNLLSYAFSLTSMRLGTFVAVTWLGLLPITCFHVYLGSLVHDVADLLDGKSPPLGPSGWVATVAGLLLTGAALAGATHLGQRALARQGV